MIRIKVTITTVYEIDGGFDEEKRIEYEKKRIAADIAQSLNKITGMMPFNVQACKVEGK